MDDTNNNPVDPNMNPNPAGEPMDVPGADPVTPEEPSAPAEGGETPAA